jgi:hypothetical protein
MKSAYVYFYRIVACVKMSYIELECTWIHDFPGASNDTSMSKTDIVLQERRVSIIEFNSSAHMIY